jgi:biotin synthase
VTEVLLESSRTDAASNLGPPESVADVEALLGRPLLDLVFEAASTHRLHHSPRHVQCSELLSIKTGGCPEDCAYCSQSAHFDTHVERHALLPVATVAEAARRAKTGGADRFCMGAAWRSPPKGKDFEHVLEMIREVKAAGLETCATLGMLNQGQAAALKEAGLDYYSHNLDTGRSHYGSIVTTRTIDDRLTTMRVARDAGLRLCSGGILGMGESGRARAELLYELATFDPPPESIPINTLVAVPGTPLEGTPAPDWTELVRVIAVARILMPNATIRLSAGRAEASEAVQALCFLAGANSIFVGEQLLTTDNTEPASDAVLLAKLGLEVPDGMR